MLTCVSSPPPCVNQSIRSPSDDHTEISKSPVSKVPVELAKHEAAQARVSREMKRRRDAEDQG